MGRKTIANQIHSALANRVAFGESTYKIYSFSTYDTYTKVGREYARWIADNKGIKYGSLAKSEENVKEYIETRLSEGKSIYTLKMERSALSMVYGHRYYAPCSSWV